MEVAPLLSESKLAEAVSRLAGQIEKDYAGRVPLLIGCLTGSFVFMADLVRRIKIPLECDFMKISSYEDQMSAGKIRLLLDNTLPVTGRDVVIIEDIVDTGASLAFIRERIGSKKPMSLASCVLLYKESPRVTIPKKSVEYLGVTIPDVFVVGYGIDYAQKYRELPYVGVVKNRP